MIGRSCSPSRCSSLHALLSWPLPPSTMTRSGRRTGAKVRGYFVAILLERDDLALAGGEACEGVAGDLLRELCGLRMAFARLPAARANSAAAPPPPCWRNHSGPRRS